MAPTKTKRVRRPPTKRTRDLTKALYLRPIEVFYLYGIPPSTLHYHATLEDETKRLPSKKIRGTRGNKGIRLFRKEDVEAWIDAQTETGGQAA